MSLLRKLADARGRRHALAALRWLAAARLWHARHGAAECFARLQAEAPPIAGRPGAAPEPLMMRWALEAAGKRVPWRADCVVQALAAKFWLESHGIDSAFHLGAQREGGAAEDGAAGFLAHAWLEVSGVPVSGGAPSGVLTRFGAAGARPAEQAVPEGAPEAAQAAGRGAPSAAPSED